MTVERRGRHGAVVATRLYGDILPTLEIGPGALILRGPGIHYVFSREGVAVEAVRGLFSPGLRPRHADPALPPHVVFWTLQPRAVKASLAAHGYTFATPA